MSCLSHSVLMKVANAAGH